MLSVFNDRHKLVWNFLWLTTIYPKLLLNPHITNGNKYFRIFNRIPHISNQYLRNFMVNFIYLIFLCLEIRFLVLWAFKNVMENLGSVGIWKCIPTYFCLYSAIQKCPTETWNLDCCFFSYTILGVSNTLLQMGSLSRKIRL